MTITTSPWMSKDRRHDHNHLILDVQEPNGPIWLHVSRALADDQGRICVRGYLGCNPGRGPVTPANRPIRYSRSRHSRPDVRSSVLPPAATTRLRIYARHGVTSCRPRASRLSGSRRLAPGAPSRHRGRSLLASFALVPKFCVVSDFWSYGVLERSCHLRATVHMKMPFTSCPVPAAMALASTPLQPSTLGANSFQYSSPNATIGPGCGRVLEPLDGGTTAPEVGAEKQALERSKPSSDTCQKRA